MKELTEEHQLVEMFERLDRDKNGYIDRDEMAEALKDVFHAKEARACRRPPPLHPSS